MNLSRVQIQLLLLLNLTGCAIGANQLELAFDEDGSGTFELALTPRANATNLKRDTLISGTLDLEARTVDIAYSGGTIACRRSHEATFSACDGADYFVWTETDYSNGYTIEVQLTDPDGAEAPITVTYSPATAFSNILGFGHGLSFVTCDSVFVVSSAFDRSGFDTAIGTSGSVVCLTGGGSYSLMGSSISLNTTDVTLIAPWRSRPVFQDSSVAAMTIGGSGSNATLIGLRLESSAQIGLFLSGGPTGVEVQDTEMISSSSYGVSANSNSSASFFHSYSASNSNYAISLAQDAQLEVAFHRSRSETGSALRVGAGASIDAFRSVFESRGNQPTLSLEQSSSVARLSVFNDCLVQSVGSGNTIFISNLGTATAEFDFESTVVARLEGGAGSASAIDIGTSVGIVRLDASVNNNVLCYESASEAYSSYVMGSHSGSFDPLNQTTGLCSSSHLVDPRL